MTTKIKFQLTITFLCLLISLSTLAKARCEEVLTLDFSHFRNIHTLSSSQFSRLSKFDQQYLLKTKNILALKLNQSTLPREIKTLIKQRAAQEFSIEKSNWKNTVFKNYHQLMLIEKTMISDSAIIYLGTKIIAYKVSYTTMAFYKEGRKEIDGYLKFDVLLDTNFNPLRAMKPTFFVRLENYDEEEF